jgi:hypothetical protein
VRSGGSGTAGSRARESGNGKEFGLTWNSVLEKGSVLAGDKVSFTLDVEFVKA